MVDKSYGDLKTGLIGRQKIIEVPRRVKGLTKNYGGPKRAQISQQKMMGGSKTGQMVDKK